MVGSNLDLAPSIPEPDTEGSTAILAEASLYCTLLNDARSLVTLLQTNEFHPITIAAAERLVREIELEWHSRLAEEFLAPDTDPPR